MGSAAGQGGAGDPLGEVLEQVDVRTGDDGGDRLGHRPVVDGVGQAVRPACGPEVNLEVQIDLKGLGPGVFLGERAMRSEDTETPELDAIRLHAVRS
jgi:hypothetical protein